MEPRSSPRAKAPHIWLLLSCLWASCYGSGGETQLVGAGSVLASQLLADVFFAYRFQQPDVVFTYRTTSSPDALCRIKGSPASCRDALLGDPGDVDFASTETLLSAEDYAQFPDLQLYPTIASAVVPIYNLEGLCPNLTLSPALLADIFSGSVRSWDHPAIQTFNPLCALPNASIQIVVRADPSGFSDVFFKALASFAAKSSGVGANDTTTWAIGDAVPITGSQALLSYVMVHPYALGYTALEPAVRNQVNIARLQRGDAVIEATPQSIAYAVLEMGLSFGNNGDDPKHLTADIFGAQSDLSWPIATFSYVAVHTQSRRPGTSCAAVAELKAFWRWFWTSPAVDAIANHRGSASLPQVIRDVVLRRFMQDIVCDDQAVVPQDGVVLSGAGPPSVHDLFQKLMPIYRLDHPELQMAFTVVAGDAVDLGAELDVHPFLAIRSRLPPTVNDAAVFVFAGVGWAVVSRYPLVLDGPTLAGILDGTIQTWLDPAIQALNPDGLWAADGTALTEDRAISLFQSPSSTSASWDATMRQYTPSYTGTAVRAAPAPATEDLVQAAVAGDPDALAVVTLTSTVLPQLQPATFLRLDGAAVSPSWASIKACASHDVFRQVGRVRSLQDSVDPGCYPLAEAVYVIRRLPDCDAADAVSQEATAFIEWLFSNLVLDVVLADFSFAPLRTASTTIATLNEQALEAIACPTSATDARLLTSFLRITVPIMAALLTLGLAGLLFMGKAASQLRALQDKYPNDAVAHQCAEALASFRLDALDWLEDAPQPTEVQLAFLRLLRLLQEVQPYVPDHLKKALKKGGPLPPSAPAAPAGPGAKPGKASDREAEGAAGAAFQTSIDIADDPGGLPSVPPPLPDLPSPRAGFQPCTYLVAKFGFPDQGDQPDVRQLHDLGQVAARLVAVGRAAQASVDRVTATTVALYWGLNGAGASTLQAVKAALEMAQLHAGDGEGLGHRGLQLQVAVGLGPAAAGTVRAAERSFAVISGEEVARAVEVVARDMPRTHQCCVLVTAEVYQKVHYWVDCYPRAMLGSVLLWEPVRTLSGESEDGWERRSDGVPVGRPKVAGVSGAALQKPFQMVAQGAPWGDIRSEVDSLRSRFAGALSAVDVHCLEALVAAAGPSHSLSASDF